MSSSGPNSPLAGSQPAASNDARLMEFLQNMQDTMQQSTSVLHQRMDADSAVFQQQFSVISSQLAGFDQRLNTVEQRSRSRSPSPPPSPPPVPSAPPAPPVTPAVAPPVLSATTPSHLFRRGLASLVGSGSSSAAAQSSGRVFAQPVVPPGSQPARSQPTPVPRGHGIGSMPFDSPAAQRPTSLQQSARISDFHSQSAVVHRSVVAPSFSLKALKIADIATFCKACTEYQFINETVLHPASLVAPSLLRLLVLASSDKKVTPDNVYSLGVEEFQYLLQRYVRPRGKIEFVKALKDNVDFQACHRFFPGPSKMFEFLLTFQSEFKDLYDTLKIDNLASVPECSFKERGLIHLFLSKIPFRFGWNLYDNMDASVRYSDLHVFFTDFNHQILVAQEWQREGERLMALFTGTLVEVYKRGSDSSATSAAVSPDTSEIPDLRFLDDSPYVVDSASGGFSSGLDDFLTVGSSGSSGYTGTPLAEQPCYTALMHGSCSQPNCKRVHDDALLRRERNRFLELLLKQGASLPSVPSSGSQQQVNQLLLRDGSVRSVCPVPPSPLYTADLDDAAVEVGNGLAVVTALAAEDISSLSQPGDVLYDAVHFPGSFLLRSGPLKVVDCLFDSGASGSDYVSQAFVDAHSELLSPYLLSANATAKLGAQLGTTDVVVTTTQRLRCTISFDDPSGGSAEAVLDFQVLPTTSFDVVIGLPSILWHFYHRYTSILAQAHQSLIPFGASAVTPTIPILASLDGSSSSSESTSPSVVAFLPSFDFTIEHIPGRCNFVADLFSRDGRTSPVDDPAPDLAPDPAPDAAPDAAAPDPVPTPTPDAVVAPTFQLSEVDMVWSVHGGRSKHSGVRRTWQRLHCLFPGHRLSVSFVSVILATCTTCQQVRRMWSDDVLPVFRVFDPGRAALQIEAGPLGG
mmetsp:Transcript_16258/g.27262  ORF Transcript_16258/g.27262 Transcript_16258/m.27262 type:complete len:914 (-) Transcript_16258:3864-6605(-)